MTNMICRIISAMMASFFREWPWPSSPSVALVAARCLPKPRMLKLLEGVRNWKGRNLP